MVHTALCNNCGNIPETFLVQNVVQIVLRIIQVSGFGKKEIKIPTVVVRIIEQDLFIIGPGCGVLYFVQY